MPGGKSARQRGDYFERQVRTALQLAGWFVIRAAGSHGPADLVALRAQRKPLLVSCKLNGRLGPAERQELLDAARAAGGRPVLATRPRRGRVLLGVVLQEGKRIAPIDELDAPRDEETDPSLGRSIIR